MEKKFSLEGMYIFIYVCVCVHTHSRMPLILDVCNVALVLGLTLPSIWQQSGRNKTDEIGLLTKWVGTDDSR